MKKNIIILLLFSLFIFGCNKKEEEKPVENDEEDIVIDIPPDEDIIIEEPEEEYIDENNTPIALYRNKEKVVEYKQNIQVGKDIAIFKVFLSNDDYLSYQGSFGDAFYNKWNEYNKDGKLKIGFNIKYDLNNGQHISQNVLHLPDTFAYEGYILFFLYDDYDLNKYNKVYSHLEEEKDNSLFSSIKLYPQSTYPDITSKILFTVFTYDSEDDFDENNEYRGNSKYTITICDTKKTC